MDELPVEVIGKILSLVGDFRNVALASATCRRWREASREHLTAVSFNSKKSPLYDRLTTSKMSDLITETVCRTLGLRELLISMCDFVHTFSVSELKTWITHAGGTLRRLSYKSCTKPYFSFAEIFGVLKLKYLEELVLYRGHITGVELDVLRFPCLKRLSLCYVIISNSDLSLLLATCPKIESLVLVCGQVRSLDGEVDLELSSSSLKKVFIDSTCFENVVLKADSIEYVNLHNGSYENFELVGKGTLEHFEAYGTGVKDFEISESKERLEVLDLGRFVMSIEYCEMISGFTELRRLRLWDIYYGDTSDLLDLETIAVCCPQLNYLSLRWGLRDEVLHHMLQGSSLLKNVLILELGWTEIGDLSRHLVLFSRWVEGIVNRCPVLLQLVIYGVAPEMKSPEESQSLDKILDKFSSSVSDFMRNFTNAKVRFELDRVPESMAGWLY